MNSTQRVLTALGYQEPDRVPYAFLAGMHPARHMGLSLREYYSRPRHMIEGQLWLRQWLGNDLVCGYPYSALEMVPWGGGVVFFEDGPPNAGEPVITRAEDISRLEPPRVADCPVLGDVLETMAGLKRALAGEALVVGAVVSPFSLPIMQMGFEAYLVLIYERPDLWARLMEVNLAYCLEWGNAQLAAGADVIACFDPAASTTIVPPDLAIDRALIMDQRLIAGMKGPVAIHFASGRSLELVDRIADIGAVVVSSSVDENLASLKASCQGRLGILGGLNALEMLLWTPTQAEAAVKKALAQAGRGGGFVLCDHHGEIPYQVDPEVLGAMAEAVRVWGRYPLDWV